MCLKPKVLSVSHKYTTLPYISYSHNFFVGLTKLLVDDTSKKWVHDKLGVDISSGSYVWYTCDDLSLVTSGGAIWYGYLSFERALCLILNLPTSSPGMAVCCEKTADGMLLYFVSFHFTKPIFICRWFYRYWLRTPLEYFPPNLFKAVVISVLSRLQQL